MQGPDPFQGLLPPGWTVSPDRWDPDLYVVRDGAGRQDAQCKVDATFAIGDHLRNLWWKHTFPDAPPKLFFKYVNDPDWLPENLRPAGSKSLDEMGSLGG